MAWKPGAFLGVRTFTIELGAQLMMENPGLYKPLTGKTWTEGIRVVQPIFVIKAGTNRGIPILLFRFHGDKGFSWENLQFCHGLSPAGKSVQWIQSIMDIHGRRRRRS